MNLERIRERQGNFNGHEHNHAGQHSHLRRIDSAVAKVREFLQGDPVVGGHNPDTQPRGPYMPEGEGTEIELFVAPTLTQPK